MLILLGEIPSSICAITFTADVSRYVQAGGRRWGKIMMRETLHKHMLVILTCRKRWLDEGFLKIISQSERLAILKEVYAKCKFWTLLWGLINEYGVFIWLNAFVKQQASFHKGSTKFSSAWLLSQLKCRAPIHRHAAERKGQTQFIIHKSEIGAETQDWLWDRQRTLWADTTTHWFLSVHLKRCFTKEE